MNSLKSTIHNSYRWILQPVLVLVVLLVGFIAAKGLSSKDNVTPAFEKRVYSPLVDVEETRVMETPVRMKASGSLEARTRVSLVAQVGGRVISIHPGFRSGGSFEANQALLTIEPRDFELAVARSGAEVSSAQTSLQSMEAEAEAAREEWKALNGDKAVPTLVAKEPQLEEAQARIAAANAQLESAQLDLSRARLALPWAGRMVDTMVDVGGVVTKGQSLGMAYSTEAFELSLPLRQDQLQWVHLADEPSNLTATEQGPQPITVLLEWPQVSRDTLLQDAITPMEQSIRAVEGIRRLTSQAAAGMAWVTVRPTGEFDTEYMFGRIQEALDVIDAFPPENAIGPRLVLGPGPTFGQAIFSIGGQDIPLPARAVRIESELDSMSRFAHLVMQIDTSSLNSALVQRLLPGTFAEAQIEGDWVRGVTSIPRSSLRNGRHVWLIQEDRLMFQSVEIVHTEQEHVWVRGIETGSLLVTSDLEVVTDGMQVRVALPTGADSSSGHTEKDAPSPKQPSNKKEAQQ